MHKLKELINNRRKINAKPVICDSKNMAIKNLTIYILINHLTECTALLQQNIKAVFKDISPV